MRCQHIQNLTCENSVQGLSELVITFTHTHTHTLTPVSCITVITYIRNTTRKIHHQHHQAAVLVIVVAMPHDDLQLWAAAWGSHWSSRTMDGSLLAPSMNSSMDSLPSKFLSIWRKILSVRFSGVDSSSGIFITVPTILYIAWTKTGNIYQIIGYVHFNWLTDNIKQSQVKIRTRERKLCTQTMIAIILHRYWIVHWQMIIICYFEMVMYHVLCMG